MAQTSPRTTPSSSITARLALARDVARSLLGTLDAAALGRVALTHIARLVSADAALVLLRDDRGGVVTLAGDPLPLEEATLLDGWVDSDIDRHGSMMWNARALPLPKCAMDTTLRADGALHGIVAALHARDAVRGLVVMRRRSDVEFHPDDLAALEEVAAPLSLALDNARLHRHLEESFVSLRNAQEELVRRERLAAVGTMATVLAHEVRTPIAVVFNSVSSLRKLGVAEHGDAATLLQIVDEEARRLELLVEDLLEFGRPPVRSFLEVDAWQLLQSAVEGVRRNPHVVGHATIELAERREPLIRASWDAQGVRQALLNVLANACQAFALARRDGVVRVSVSNDARGDRVRFTVEDNGDGITPEVRARMFEPFVTSRPRGIGLGLAVVRRVVDDHQGELLVDTAVGRGTRFDLVLPRRLAGR